MLKFDYFFILKAGLLGFFYLVVASSKLFIEEFFVTTFDTALTGERI